jgi:hypothetical protein
LFTSHLRGADWWLRFLCAVGVMQTIVVSAMFVPAYVWCSPSGVTEKCSSVIEDGQTEARPSQGHDHIACTEAMGWDADPNFCGFWSLGVNSVAILEWWMDSVWLRIVTSVFVMAEGWRARMPFHRVAVYVRSCRENCETLEMRLFLMLTPWQLV